MVAGGESSAPASDTMARPAEKHDGSVLYVLLLTLVAALGGLLFGYDTAVISGAIGFLAEHFDLDPQVWTGWAAACALLGCALGAAMAGMASDRFGAKGYSSSRHCCSWFPPSARPFRKPSRSSFFSASSAALALAPHR